MATIEGKTVGIIGYVEWLQERVPPEFLKKNRAMLQEAIEDEVMGKFLGDKEAHMQGSFIRALSEVFMQKPIIRTGFGVTLLSLEMTLAPSYADEFSGRETIGFAPGGIPGGFRMVSHKEEHVPVDNMLLPAPLAAVFMEVVEKTGFESITCIWNRPELLSLRIFYQGDVEEGFLDAFAFMMNKALLDLGL